MRGHRPAPGRSIGFALSHRLSFLLHYFFHLLPAYEIGLSSMGITRIVHRHEPLAGRRAVHLSDLHVDRYQSRHDTVLATIADLAPDWIFVTGDLLTVSGGLPHLFRFLSGLRAIAPVYMTLGNHDHYSGVPIDRFLEMAERHMVHLLINQTVLIPLKGGELAIVGVDDPSLHRADLSCIPAAIPGRFTVLLAHAPIVLDLLDESHAVDLILCGHSHGGQWRVPYIPSFWLPYGCSGRSDGHYIGNRHRLYVNRGLGWSLLPVRLGCPPEIVLIEWQ
jgi:predicted MPP superfamily phosphohydrolase